jgi:hypothetical protein
MDDLFKGKDKQPEIVKNEDGSYTIGGKHYKDVDALLNKAAHADRHIETVLAEKRQMEERAKQLESGSSDFKSLQDKMDALLNSNRHASFFEEETDKEKEKNVTQENRQTYSPEELSAVIEASVQKAVKPLQDKLEATEVKSKEDQFRKGLLDVYGTEDAVVEAMDKFRKSSGLTPELIKELVKHNPAGTTTLVTNTVPKPKSKTTLTQDPAQTGGVKLRDTQQEGNSGEEFQALATKLRNAGKTGAPWTAQDQAALNTAFEKRSA